MVFSEGLSVSYKNINGVIDFVSDTSISILVVKGEHRSKDVKIVVYKSEFRNVNILGEK